MRKLATHRSPVAWLAAGTCATALAIVILAAIPATRRAIEWGSVPNWIAVGAGLLALTGVAISYQTLVTTLKHRRDDEASPARLLIVTDIAAKPSRRTGDVELGVTLQNVSGSTFSNIQLVGIMYEDKLCEPTDQQFADEQRQPMMVLLPPGERVAFRRLLPRDADWTHPTFITYRTKVLYTYTDGNGRRWQRISASEPSRIYEAPPTADDFNDFDVAFRHAGSGG